MSEAGAHEMAGHNSGVEDEYHFEPWLLLDWIAQHIQGEIVEKEHQPAPEHKTTEEDPPHFQVMRDGGLELAEEHVLHARPIMDAPQIVQQIHAL